MALLKVSDDRGRELVFGVPPKRVVSLVPSDTLSVAMLGASGALVGRTDYCVLPDEIAKVPSVGGTKNPRIADVLALEPDLVLANQEENSRGDLEALVKANVRVLIAFPKRVAEGIAHLARLARIFRVESDPEVRALCKQAYQALKEAEAARETLTPFRVFCPIWMSPLMTIHGATFISDMLDLAGAQNVFADRERRYPLAADLGGSAPLPEDRIAGRDVRYPRVTLAEVVSRAPELVVLPDEPHPFTDADADVFRALPIPAAERGRVAKIDGKDLCWYGARSAEGIGRVRETIARLRQA